MPPQSVLSKSVIKTFLDLPKCEAITEDKEAPKFFKAVLENGCLNAAQALKSYQFDNPTFLSYELLYLYKQEYLKSLDLGFPIAWYDKRVDEILEQDANAKYINYVEYNLLDDGNKTGIPFPSNPNTENYNEGIRGDYLSCCGDKPCHC